MLTFLFDEDRNSFTKHTRSETEFTWMVLNGHSLNKKRTARQSACGPFFRNIFKTFYLLPVDFYSLRSWLAA